MGLSLSLLSSAWVEIFRHNLFKLATNISLNPRDAKMTLRSLGSFKRRSESVSDPVGPIRKNGINLRNCRPEKVLVLDRSFSFKDYLVQDDTKKETEEAKKPPRSAPEHVPFFSSPRPAGELDAAAVKLQKVYKSYRTRRNLADCAVVVEELWWKALDFAALKRSSVSFFDLEKPESAVSRWARARTRAAKVGKGLSKDDKAQKLALQHWLEAIDPRHRYGHNLHLYYEIWFQSESSQPFFHWLDIGEGKEVHLEKCPRSRLQRQCIKYLGPKEREVYEVIVENGKLMYRHSGVAVETTAEGSKAKWIFVLSTTRTLYVGQKIKGQFQHSSFLSGGATTAAGRLVAHNGLLEAIWPYSGHYHPTEENFLEFISFLEEKHVDLTDVKRCAIDDDYVSMKSVDEEPVTVTTEPCPNSTHQSGAIDQGRDKSKPTDEICRGEKERAFHLGERLSCKWTTGAGPRIGCVRDYPVDLQTRALEQVNLSPRLASGLFNYGPVPSPRPSPKIHLSPRLAYMGLPSPRTPVPTAAN